MTPESNLCKRSCSWWFLMQHFLMEGRKGQKGIWEAEMKTSDNIYYTVLK